MLQRFIPLLTMTFFICLFIVLMQFLWRYIDELVGKGLSISVVGELFFYAALTMVPTALPLAVLLASLMTFGNLGEKFELTAMKAAGISLFRIMKPLIILIALIACGAFFFQNNVLPIAQTKMWTLLFSVRQKSPEVEIPERSFYKEIPDMNIYVGHKNQATGVLHDMIIYDLTRGLDNTRVILADSGKFSFTEDRTRLFLHLHNGELFENLRDNSMGFASQRYLPFRREHFSDKQVYFAFDANFNRIDEQGMRSQYIGQNISQLSRSIDSLSRQVDSIGDSYARELRTSQYVGLALRTNKSGDAGPQLSDLRRDVAMPQPLPIDSLLASPTPLAAKNYISQALNNAKRQRADYEFKAAILTEEAKLMRRHDIELQKKFTLSIACLIFFFIGAPLGAIIKKGGIGTPLVISVLLFIVYYIIDNTGYKMARDGKIAVWQGIWLSSAILLPMGVFFTYKAVGDSAVFNADAYRNFLLRLIGHQPKRDLEVKEVIMSEVNPSEALGLLQRLLSAAESVAPQLSGLKGLILGRRYLSSLRQPLNDVIEHLSNARSAKIIGLLNTYPFIISRRNINGVILTTKQLIDTLTVGLTDTDVNNSDNEHYQA
ncbi:MAG: LptF/LptG family permease [Muribaculaceae bacterium]